MTHTVKPTRIRPFEDYGNMKDGDLLTCSQSVVSNITGNDKFPDPPLDLKIVKAHNDTFASLLVQCLDGGRQVVAQKNKQRQVIIKDLRLLGGYVEFVAAGDLATFNSSGFVAVLTARGPRACLSPHIYSLDHGQLTGQLIVRMKSVPGASSYELRYAPVTNGTPETWISRPVTRLQPPVILNGLTPGTVYALQARALQKDGYSDWSDSLTLMCI